MKSGLKGFLAILSGFVLIGLFWNLISTKLLNEKEMEENSKMKFNALTPNLMVSSVNKTIDFYNEVFGFETAITVPEEGDLNWAMITKDSVRLMIQKRESLEEDLLIFKNESIGGSFTLFIEVDDVEEVYNKAKGKCELIEEMKTTFYGMKEFTVRDINGYVLTFAERVENN